ncbi:MAG: RNA-guided endonuclease TnpB family protein [Candidatus Micrarchaeota archaeon]|nr:RNA-guided endonuclease TnpB family protein [Candidatus Micrarchaeota archaeon]
MEVIRAWKFRIYPTGKQGKEIQTHLWLSKNIWNNLLEYSKNKYNETRKFPSKIEFQSMVKDSGLYSQTAQAVSHRLYNALLLYFRMKKKDKNAGFPRFKNMDRMKSLLYPQSGFKIAERKLEVTPFGEISIRKHREMKGTVKTLMLKRESSGKFYAIFTIKMEITPKENKGKQIGMDLGLINFATLSDRTVIKNPRHLKRYEERLAKRQGEVSNKEKGTIRRKKQKVKVAVLHEKIRNTRMDFLHKLSLHLVNSYSFIALEDLSIKKMSMERLGKSINDAGWNEFSNMLYYKAEEAGCRVVFVDPDGTTKECSSCGEIIDKELKERRHTCPSCGLSMDRDLNASINILKRATAGQAESNARGVGQQTDIEARSQAF